MAGEEGREVFAVPGSPLDPRCAGTNNLIRQGAVLTENARDVTKALGGVLSQPLAKGRLPDDFGAAPRPLANESKLEKARAAIIELLSPTPVEVDELIRQCQVSAAVALTVLLEPELAGWFDRHPGNKFSIQSEEC